MEGSKEMEGSKNQKKDSYGCLVAGFIIYNNFNTRKPFLYMIL
jgi:hypothetical protein